MGESWGPLQRGIECVYSSRLAVLPDFPLKGGVAQGAVRMKGITLPEQSALAAQGSPGSLPSPPRPSSGTILALVNGVLAGIGGVFVGTHSVLVTVIAAVVAVVLAGMVLIAQR